jgi:benzodiazapine receptor
MKIEKRVKRFLIAFTFVILVALLGSYFTAEGMNGWYQTLRLPSVAPGGELIGIVWMILYALLTLSIIAAWEQSPKFALRRLGMLYVLNGALNAYWSYLFFVMHRIDLAFLGAIALLLSVGVLIVANMRFSRLAAFLLLPYLLWVAYASYLTGTIWSLNNGHHEPVAIVSEGNASEKLDLIRLSNPKPEATVDSPLVIEGEARGSWFFEASFPIEIQDENGTVIGQGHATAGSDWMTEDFVPFTAQIAFTKPSGSTGKLILRKDNPSGLPEKDDELWIPVTFKNIESLSTNLTNLKVGDRFTHGDIDGVVTEINDSRCKAGVTCIWAGELSVTLQITQNQGEGHEPDVIRLGTTTKKSAESSGYTFTLVSATEKMVTLSINP